MLTLDSGVSKAELTSLWITNSRRTKRIGVTVMQQLLLRLRRWNAAFLRISAPACVPKDACIHAATQIEPALRIATA